MRLPFFTLFLLNLTLYTLFPTLTSALHPHAVARRRDHNHSPVPHVLTSRQHHVARDLLDVCIDINVDLLANEPQLLGLGSVLSPIDLGSKIELCLCLKDLDIYLETNDDVQTLVGLFGKNTVGALITALINTSPEAQRCIFPQHAHHTCNNFDPCHYECDSPYVLEGGACVCAPPYSSCNGVCDIFPQGCGSAVPRSPQKRINPVVTIAQAKASCKPHETVCGIPGQEMALGFECIDTRSTKDSCGGCMTPHPFFEAEPVRHSSGKDCTAIANAKGTGCSEHRCVVHTCNDGWLPGSEKNACVPYANTSTKMRKIRKRSDPLNGNVTADANLDLGLASKLVGIVQSVLDLTAHSAAAALTLTGSATTTIVADSISVISALLADVNAATTALVDASTNPTSLLANVEPLLNTSSLLRAALNDCNCVQRLGLSDLSQDVDGLIKATLALQGTVIHLPNDVPIAANDSSSTGSVPPSSPSLPDRPITAGFSDLLSGLGLNGKSGVMVDGLGPSVSGTTNSLLNGLSIGPNNYRREESTNADVPSNLDPELLAKMIRLVNSVNTLYDDSSCLPPAPSPPATSVSNPVPSQIPSLASSGPALSVLSVVKASINTNLVDPIVQATANMLNAQTASVLASMINNLVDVNTAVQGLLVQCGCVTEMELEAWVAELEEVASAALDIQSWLQRNSVVMATPSSPLSASTSLTVNVPSRSSSSSSDADVPITVGLSSVLNIGSLGLLGPLKAGTSVDGLDGLVGHGTSGLVNGLLNGVEIGPANYKRRDAPPLSADADATVTIDTALSSQIETLVGSIIKLEGLMSLPPSIGAIPLSSQSGGPSTPSSSAIPIDPSMLASLEQATANFLQSPTLETLSSNIDALYAAECALQRALNPEETEWEGVLDELVSVIQATLALKGWCMGNLGGGTVPSGLMPVVSGSNSVVSGPTGTRTVLSVGASSATAKSAIPGPTGASTLLSVSAGAGSTTAASHAVSTSTLTHSSPVSIPTSPAPKSADIPVIIGLDHLLSGLGLGTVKGVVTIDNGLLGDGLDSNVNGMLDGFGIGPHGVRRGKDVGLGRRQELMNARRQIIENGITTAAVNGELISAVDELIGLVLKLSAVGSVLPPAPIPVPVVQSTTVHLSTPASATPSTTLYLGGFMAAHALPTVAALSSGSLPAITPAINRCLVDNVVAATMAVLSSTTSGELVSTVDALVSTSMQSLQALEACSCVAEQGYLEVSQYFVEIVSATEALSAAAQKLSGTSARPPASDGPVVAGLPKLLTGLGLSAKADTAVDGLLGGGLDAYVTVHSALDVLSVGPSGLRRRIPSAER